MFVGFPSQVTWQNSQVPATNSLFIFTENMQKGRLVRELVLSLLTMNYGCFSNKIWLSGTNGCSNLILLV